MKIVGYCTSNNCVLGAPDKFDPSITQYMVEDEKGNIQIIYPPLNPADIPTKKADLETLLKIDPASGEKPVPILEWNEYFFVREGYSETAYSLNGELLGFLQPTFAPTPYNTTPQIVDEHGEVLGYYNEYEVYNQSGGKIAERLGWDIIYEDTVIGYLYRNQSKLLNKDKKLIGTTEGGVGKILREKKVIANAADYWGDSANDLFFLSEKGATKAPELSFKKIQGLQLIAKGFHPKTEWGRAFRKKLFAQIKLIKKLRRQAKRNPKKILGSENLPLAKVVAIWLLVEDKKLDEEGLDLIIAAAQDPEENRFVKYAAISALGKLKKGTEAVATALYYQNKDNKWDFGIQKAALQALDNMTGEDNRSWINNHLIESIFKNDKFIYRKEALKVLKKNDPKLANKLVDMIKDPGLSLTDRSTAIEALKIIEAKEIAVFIPELSFYPPEIRAALIATICVVLPEKMEDVAEKTISDPDPLVRKALISGLWRIENDQAEQLVIEILKNDSSEEVRKAAIDALTRFGGEKTVDLIEDALNASHSKTSSDTKTTLSLDEAIHILGYMEGERALLLLTSALDAPNKSTQKAALEALRTMGLQGTPKALPFLLLQIKKVTDQELFRSILAILRYITSTKEYHTYCKTLIPELRPLLKDERWEVRDFAARTLARLGDNIFPLLDEIDPKLIDPQILHSIGREIGWSQNNGLFEVVLHNTFKAKSAKDLKKYAYILLGALNAWQEKLGSLKNTEMIFLDKLKSTNSSPSLKRLCIYALTKLIALRDHQKADKIAKSLLDIKGPLENFILRNLAAKRDHFSPSIRTTIEDKVKDMLISQSPPYEEWFNQAKNPNKIINAKIYCQLFPFEWNVPLISEGFEKIESTANESIWKKKINGITLRVTLVDISNEQGKLRTDIFQDLADPKIHYIGYNGHAGMGGNIEMKEPRKNDVPTSFGTKIVHIGACASMYSYYSRVLKLAPNVQFIGNISLSYSLDDMKVFLATINGIAFQKSWDEIGQDIKEKGPFVYHYQDLQPITFLNHMLPNNIDQFKYAVLNELEIAGAETLSFGAPQEDILDINAQSGGRLRQAVNNVNVSFSYHPFFENAEITTGDEIHDGIYFLSPTDEQTPLRIWQASNNGRPIFEIKVNAGYSHLSIDALTILLLYDLNSYFAKEKHGDLTKEDKLRGLLMVAEYIHYHYQGREVDGLQMFELFKQKYGFSQEILFEDVYHLQEALDNNLPQKEELEAKLLGMIN